MDLDALNKLVKNAPLYFPVISWIYIVDKTNTFFHLIILIFVISFIFFYKKLILNLATKSKVNEKKIKSLCKKGDKEKALDHVYSKIKEDINRHKFIHLYLLLILFICNLTAILELRYLLEYQLAKFLLLVIIPLFSIKIFEYSKEIGRVSYKSLVNQL